MGELHFARRRRAGAAPSKGPERLQAFSCFCQGFPWILQIFPWILQAFLWWFRGVSKGCKGKKEKKIREIFRRTARSGIGFGAEMPERAWKLGMTIQHGA
jgi:hypothetical protein